MWKYRGQERPAFAEPTGPGQESVWDYPRPPEVVPDRRHVVVRAQTQVLADTHQAQRVLETGSPPTFYLPPEDVRTDMLHPLDETTHCEWKGTATYWALVPGGQAVAWTYAAPYPGYRSITGWYAFYPERVACAVDGEPVAAQPGPYYGGWVTAEIVGPVKGKPGTEQW